MVYGKPKKMVWSMALAMGFPIKNFQTHGFDRKLLERGPWGEVQIEQQGKLNVKTSVETLSLQPFR